MIQGHVELSTEVTGRDKWTAEIWMVFIRGAIRTPQKGRKQRGSEQEEGNLRSPSTGSDVCRKERSCKSFPNQIVFKTSVIKKIWTINREEVFVLVTVFVFLCKRPVYNTRITTHNNTQSNSALLRSPEPQSTVLKAHAPHPADLIITLKGWEFRFEEPVGLKPGRSRRNRRDEEEVRWKDWGGEKERKTSSRDQSESRMVICRCTAWTLTSPLTWCLAYVRQTDGGGRGDGVSVREERLKQKYRQK